MAKFTKLLGSARGRVGGLVFSKGENGENYVRSYQPTVANPKTTIQKGQRAKMNLVGRMSAVTPMSVLAGMGGVNGRGRRSRFNSILLKAASIENSDPSQIVAKIEPTDVVFSEGASAVSAAVSTPMTVTANGATVGLTLADTSLAGAYGEKIVLAIIDPNMKGGYSVIVASDIIFEDTTAVTVNFSVPSEIEEGSLVCLYRVPFILSVDGRATISTTNIYNNGSDILAELLTSGSAVRAWGRSILEDTKVFTQA